MPTETPSARIASALTQILKSDLPGMRLREGEVAEVTLLSKTSREAYFDLGRLGTGIVFGVEFQNAKHVLKNLEPGSKIPAKVVDLDGEGGYAELSLVEAGKQRLWQQAQDLMDAGEIIAMKITGANAGGLTGSVVDLKAFLPTSQLSNDHQPKVADGNRQKMLEDLKKLVGEELSVKIITVNPRNNKFIVSEREILSAGVKELLASYTVGQTVDGIVSGLADFGIFVRFADNPQIEGLVHISEIDHRIVDNPKDMMKLNEAVQVKIIDIREGRVFLSLKALRVNPWDTVLERYSAGQAVSGNVYKFNPFGAIIELEGGIQGIIHISEFGGLDEMRSAIPQGTAHEFTIETIKPEEKRLILKLKK